MPPIRLSCLRARSCRLSSRRTGSSARAMLHRSPRRDTLMTMHAGAPASDIESPYAWLRLVAAVTLSTVGGVGMWSVVVALPAIQADFGVDRAAASLPYTLAMIGFAGGGVVIGRLVDRFGILFPLALGTISLAAGYVCVGLSPNLTLVALAHTL